MDGECLDVLLHQYEPVFEEQTVAHINNIDMSDTLLSTLSLPGYFPSEDDETNNSIPGYNERIANSDNTLSSEHWGGGVLVWPWPSCGITTHRPPNLSQPHMVSRYLIVTATISVLFVRQCPRDE